MDGVLKQVVDLIWKLRREWLVLLLFRVWKFSCCFLRQMKGLMHIHVIGYFVRMAIAMRGIKGMFISHQML